ncbi:tyrosine-type recombinase/integrase [Streptomyces sp. NPDC059009]|uniref:tyrosine-type recombinase/integrase n=1 Tax=Streptomyces sp. NPDC059009 TaxID=3346694 RepID=UPI0036CD1F5D
MNDNRHTPGRIYRRCGCRGQNGKQLGAHCPQLATNQDHGSWALAIDAPRTPDGRRRTIRRSGFTTHGEAESALTRVRENLAAGLHPNPTETLAAYLLDWLQAIAPRLQPTTLTRYRAYTLNDLIPALAPIPLDTLTRTHITAFAVAQQASGRGPVTLHRCLRTLSSALTHAVRTGRLPHNPALPAILPASTATPVDPWSATETAAFLTHARHTAPYLYDLCTVLISTGLRRGEALGLSFEDIDFNTRRLYVRRSLTTVDNNHLVLGAPKTTASTSWIPLTTRSLAALRRRKRATRRTTGLVFAQPDGTPPRPQQVLNDFRETARTAGLRPIALKDQRHGTATILIAAGIPLILVSKLLRHTQLATTADLYTHLTSPAAANAVRILDTTLTRATRTLRWHRLLARLRPPHDHHPSTYSAPTSQNSRIDMRTALTVRPSPHPQHKRPSPRKRGDGL